MAFTFSTADNPGVADDIQVTARLYKSIGPESNDFVPLPDTSTTVTVPGNAGAGYIKHAIHPIGATVSVQAGERLLLAVFANSNSNATLSGYVSAVLTLRAE